MTVRPNEATLYVRNDGLLGPVLTRVIGMLAARAQCPIDRLDDALLVADAVAAHSPEYSNDRIVAIKLAAQEGMIEFTVTGLRAQGARGLLSESDLPGVGNVLEQVADAVEVRDGNGDAGESLVLRLGFEA